MEVVITDDGQYVITLDNHHSVGYGEDVVAIYARRGLIKKYSLEAVLAEVPRARDGGFWNLFSHSVSSRWWRESSIKLISGEGAEARFGIWLGWARRWFVWQLADGTMVKLNEDAARQWNIMGRHWALEQLEEAQTERIGVGRDLPAEKVAPYHVQVTACRYIGYAKNQADRELLKRLLDNDVPNGNWDLELRRTADRSLAMVDGVDLKLLEKESGGLYRLGTVKVDVRFPHGPGEDEGQIYLSIFSDTVKPDSWRQARPAFRGGQRFTKPLATRPVAIDIPPLKPGRYWVKVVWDRTPPFDFNLYLYDGMTDWKKSNTPAPTAGADDFESRAEAFEVKAGKAVELRVACDRPGTRP
ncbi:MAG TPA: hypothetical protein VGP94_02905 [Tepidisphaeraceae bacterium]|nr:hypothetical protein [Tepidisphaeraceae bacterium]